MAGLGLVSLVITPPVSGALFAAATQIGTASTVAAIAAGGTYLVAQEPEEAFEEGVSAFLRSASPLVFQDFFEGTLRLRGDLLGPISQHFIAQADEINDILITGQGTGEALGNSLAIGWSGMTDEDP